MQTTRLYIDGAFVAPHAGGSFEAINPATETAFARIAAGTAKDVDRAVRSARRAFDQGPWGGYKSSGIGRELGKAGFMGFREIKQIKRYDHTRNWGWYLEP